MAALELVDYVAPPVVGLAYILSLLFTRQQLVRSSSDALGAYVQGVATAHPEAAKRLEEIGPAGKAGKTPTSNLRRA